MAGNVKGITVEIDGDTTKLTKAMGKVNGEGKRLSDELKEVEKLLKFDPSNTTLLAQKQKILADSIGNVEEKLTKLRSVQDQVEAQFKANKLPEEEYRKFQREIAKTESYLTSLQKKSSDLEVELKADTSDIKKAENAVEDLGDTAEETGKRGSKALGAFGVAVGATVGAIGGLIAGTAELNGDLARLETNALQAGYSMGDIEKEFVKVAGVSGEMDSAVETLSNLMQTDFSQNQLSEAIDYINAGAIRFSDTLKTEGIADGLQETFATGSAVGQFGELLERSGVSLDTFNAGLATAKKNGTETDYVLQQLSALGLSDTLEAYEKSNGALIEYNQAQVGLQLALAGLGERLMPLATLVMNLGTAFVEWANKAFDAVSAMNLFSGGITAGLPQMLQAGSQMLTNMIQGITNNLPQLVETALTVVNAWLQNMANMYPLLIEAGVQIVGALVQGLATNLPVIVQGIAGVITSIVETILQLLPQIVEMGAEILTSLVDGIVTLVPSLINTILDLIVQVIETLTSNLPKFVDSGVKMLDSILNGIEKILPELVPMAVNIVQKLITTITENLPKIVDSGVKLLSKLIEGISKTLPKLVSTAIDLVLAIAKTILQNLPEILSAGIKIIGKLVEGLVSAIPDIIGAIVQIIGDMKDKFTEADWNEIGKDIIKGLIKGIKNMASSAVEAISGVVGSVIEKAKSLLDTNSPSRLFENEIGAMIPLGMARGIDGEAYQVARSSENMVKMSIPKIDQRAVSSGGLGNSLGKQELIVMLDSEIIGRQVYDVVGEQIVIRAGGRF